MRIENYISDAQKIFIDGKDFDLERINFIRNLQTCDLLAVPGSGKTTLLLAKLYCLAQNLPFEDNSGILILSHTNHAVEEIENKLKKLCPTLFEYPNYSGTVQSFVNRFLANQACFEKHGSYIRRNDDDLVHDFILKRLKYKKGKAYWYLANIIKAKFNKLETSFISRYDIENADAYLFKLKGLAIVGKKGELKFDYENIKSSGLSQNEQRVLFDFNKHLKEECQKDYNWIELLKTIRYNEEKGHFSSSRFSYDLKTIKDSGMELKEIFEELTINGNFKYYDSFQLGAGFLTANPELKQILQKRFRYVFIDEMQDLDNTQIDIIDKIFSSEESKSTIQRIGDLNQAIYSSGQDVKTECQWVPRNPKYLNNSYRLTQETASLVNGFTLDPQKDEDQKPRFVVRGLNRLRKPIRPHLILFDKHTTGDQLYNFFEDVIFSHGLDLDKKNLKNGFKIIAWSTVWNEEENGRDKIRLQDLFQNYTKESQAKKENFDCLKKYLFFFDRKKNTLEAARKAILNALVRVLSIESVYKDKLTGTFFRKNTLIDFIKKEGDAQYNNFKEKLFAWSFDLAVQNENNKVYKELKAFMEDDFIKWNWENEDIPTIRSISKAKEFIDGEVLDPIQTNLKQPLSIANKKAFEIDISSVHSVKGQTHCATMYIETAYKTPVYETSKLYRQTKSNPLFFKNHDCNKPTGKEALKMMYVGFSRPTHLLCFAVLKENVEKDLDDLERAGWQIKYDLIKK